MNIVMLGALRVKIIENGACSIQLTTVNGSILLLSMNLQHKAVIQMWSIEG